MLISLPSIAVSTDGVSTLVPSLFPPVLEVFSSSRPGLLSAAFWSVSKPMEIAPQVWFFPGSFCSSQLHLLMFAQLAYSSSSGSQDSLVSLPLHPVTHPQGCYCHASVSLSFKMKSMILKTSAESLESQGWRQPGIQYACPQWGLQPEDQGQFAWIAQLRPLGMAPVLRHVCLGLAGSCPWAWREGMNWLITGCLLHKSEGVTGSELAPRHAH